MEEYLKIIKKLKANPNYLLNDKEKRIILTIDELSQTDLELKALVESIKGTTKDKNFKEENDVDYENKEIIIEQEKLDFYYRYPEILNRLPEKERKVYKEDIDKKIKELNAKQNEMGYQKVYYSNKSHKKTGFIDVLVLTFIVETFACSISLIMFLLCIK